MSLSIVTPLMSGPKTGSGIVAQMGSGVVAEVGTCDGEWCELIAGGYDGFVQQTQLWGVYPGEKVD